LKQLRDVAGVGDGRVIDRGDPNRPYSAHPGSARLVEPSGNQPRANTLRIRRVVVRAILGTVGDSISPIRPIRRAATDDAPADDDLRRDDRMALWRTARRRHSDGTSQTVLGPEYDKTVDEPGVLDPETVVASAPTERSRTMDDRTAMSTAVIGAAR
jgi:hypothetical protein